MSKSFRNSIATIGSFEGFAYMLCDIVKDDPIAKDELKNQFENFRKQVRTLSYQSQNYCKGTLTKSEYDTIKAVIFKYAGEFATNDSLMDVVGYLSFTLVGLDKLIQNFKSVKKKNLNHPKIKSFTDLAKVGFSMLTVFDPDIDNLETYDRAVTARKRWDFIFEN